MIKFPNMFRNYKFNIVVGLVIYFLLNRHFDKINIPGSWEFGSGSIYMNASLGRSDLYMSTYANGSLSVYRSNFFVDHFENFREWPSGLTETCDSNAIIRMTFSKLGLNLGHERNIVTNEKFTTKFSFRKFNFNNWNIKRKDHGTNKFIIESSYKSYDSTAVDLCDPDHYLISHFMFGLVNYDKLVISLWDGGIPIRGFYRVAEYDIRSITKSDMLVVEKALTVQVIE